MTQPEISEVVDELKPKIRHIFTGRTQRFPDKKMEIIQTPEMRNKKFIIAPYNKTMNAIEKVITNAIETERKQLAQAIEQHLVFPDIEKTTRGKTQNPENPKYHTKYAKGFNDCLTQCQQAIDKLVEELRNE